MTFLFVVSFSVYGIGNYISASKSPSMGYIISASPFLGIIVFYLLDVMYGGRVRVRLNNLYPYMLVYILSGVWSLFYSLHRGLPDITLFTVIGRSLLVALPYHAFLILYAYNQRRSEEFLPKMIFYSLTLLLFVNILGYGAGLSNQGHNIEGRVNLPFFGGLYSAASVLVVMSLMLIWRMRKVWWSNPVRMSGYTAFLLVNMLFLYLINSRLTLMIFAAMLVLIFFGGIRSIAVYWVSFFMIPLLLNLSILVYQVLSLPVFASIMQRVDYENVTSFSGRSFLWEIGLAWIVDDRRGLLFGNGFQGQYFLGILREIAMLWNPRTPDKMHFHSSSLEILFNQGLFGFVPFAIVLFKLFKRYREKYLKDRPAGILFFGLVYLMFDLQVSSFVYLDGLGSLVLALIAAGVTVKEPVVASQPEPELVEMNALA